MSNTDDCVWCGSGRAIRRNGEIATWAQDAADAGCEHETIKGDT